MSNKIVGIIIFITSSVVSINISAESNTYSRHFMIQPEFFLAQINKITILPVIDDRKDNNIEAEIDFQVDFNYMLRAKSSGELITIKNYEVENFDYYEKHTAIETSDLQDPSKEWIQQLGPSDSTHILLLVFSDAQIGGTFGYYASTEIRVYLFDKVLGKLIWKNHYESQVGQGGLLGLTLGGYQGIVLSISRAIRGIFTGFPIKGMSHELFKSTWTREKILSSENEK